MGRKDWDYITIPIEMSKALDEIIKRNGRRYGIYDKVQLVRQLTADFICTYDRNNSIPEAKKSVEEMHSWKKA